MKRRDGDEKKRAGGLSDKTQPKDAFAVEPICELAGGQRQRDQRHDVNQPDKAERAGGVSPLVDLQRHGDEEHLPSENGEKRPAEIVGVVRMAKRGERIALGGRRISRCSALD